MRPSLLLVLFVAPFFASCGSVHKWRELQTAPMTFGECYDGLVYLTQHDGFTIDAAASDRGLGTLQSRWRHRQLGLNRPGRYRLIAEVMIDEGSTQTGWPVRYVIMQEKVNDLRKAMEPRESDWSTDGQDRERETIFGERLVRRLGPKSDVLEGVDGATQDPAKVDPIKRDPIKLP